jgi:methyltransferase (TIGR00027 family)
VPADVDSATSTTSLLAAVGRGLHRLRHDPPWVLDDPFALMLVGPQWREIETLLDAAFREPVRRQAIASMVVRSRYAEDRLRHQGQYVLLGAGLDSFVWRRPDVVRTVRVYEIDQPSTQAWKQERLATLGLSTDEGPTFVAADFEVETLRQVLDAAGFDWARPALLSWLGVAMYLTVEAVESVLETVAAAAPGSEIVLTYAVDPSLLDELGSEFRTTIERMAAGAGEPIRTSLSPEQAEELVASCGLEVVDHPSRDDLVARYFAERDDGVKPYDAERLLAARVPD